MARARKTKTTGELEAQADPRAALDGARFLAAAKPVLQLLGDDLAARAKASPAVTAALQARHEAEQENRRTADAFPAWQTSFIDQVAAAWLLSCVFVRTLEDRGLLDQVRLAGPGALDGQRLFLEMAPSLAERDYLLVVFRELARFPAAQALFDAKHNPVWLLAPSAEAAKALLALFRQPSAEAPAFRFGNSDTRFLGDLYQDLNEAVQKRYALLQTPRFVEKFILDRTLERAIERFGLDDTTLIDPTCGSGHFLLGAFERLSQLRLRAEPGLDKREAARRALDAVYGADINPYAVAVARFRLALAYIESGGYARLANVPDLPLHVVVADSLLCNPQLEQTSFQDLKGQSTRSWAGEELQLEDEDAARKQFGRQHAVVVANPPYTAPDDTARKESYRRMYVSASGRFTLAAPFVERIFSLARAGGLVGFINANTFATKQFGQALLRDVLPSYRLEAIIGTGGVFFPPPGFSTPTVIVLGENSSPTAQTILVQQIRMDPAEASTRADPSSGPAWSSIEAHWDSPGYIDDYIEVSARATSEFYDFPWPLVGGAAADGVAALESKKAASLVEMMTGDGAGFVGISAGGDAFLQPSDVFRRMGLEDWCLTNLTGELARDYTRSSEDLIFWPYDFDSRLRELPCNHPAYRWLWRYRTLLNERATFAGGTYRTDPKRIWYQWHQVSARRCAARTRVLFPDLSNEVHFILDDARGTAEQSLLCFVPRADLDDESIHSLLGYLNSSTVCAWLKTRCPPVGTARADISKQKGRADRVIYRLPANMAHRIPIPGEVIVPGPIRHRLATLHRMLIDLGRQREALVDTASSQLLDGHLDAIAICDEYRTADNSCRGRSVVAQEELDWTVYGTFLKNIAPIPQVPALQAISSSASPEDRPAFSQTGTVHAATEAVESGWAARRQVIETNRIVSALESPQHKRSWLGRRGAFGRRIKSAETIALDLVGTAIATLLEQQFSAANIRARVAIVSEAATSRCGALSRALAEREFRTVDSVLEDRLAGSAVPFLAAMRHTDVGLAKRAVWENSWEQQRLQDDGEPFQYMVPDAYVEADYREATFWKLRKQWDVPTERFISYPGCESDQDGEPVYGWAGWNHLQQAQALAALYQKRKTEEAWPAARLTPMLAGLLELLPWIKQWHNDPSPEHDGMRLGDFFEAYLDAECRALGLTHADLRAWRPDTTKRRAAKTPKEPKPKAAAKPRKAQVDVDAAEPPAAEEPTEAAAARSAAAKKAWATRRKRDPAAPADAGPDAAAESRSAAAKKAWATRRKHDSEVDAAGDPPTEAES